MEDLQWLFDRTPAHVVVVIYDCRHGDEAVQLTDLVSQALSNRWHAEWWHSGAVLAHRDRIASCSYRMSITEEAQTFMHFDLQTKTNYQN